MKVKLPLALSASVPLDGPLTAIAVWARDVARVGHRAVFDRYQHPDVDAQQDGQCYGHVPEDAERGYQSHEGSHGDGFEKENEDAAAAITEEDRLRLGRTLRSVVGSVFMLWLVMLALFTATLFTPLVNGPIMAAAAMLGV